MYHRDFGLREEPFGVSPDPRYFFRSSQHVEAVASLYYAITQRRGFAALIAEPGLGKTSVIVSLLEKLNNQAKVAFLVQPCFDGPSALDAVLVSLGIDPQGSMLTRYRQLEIFLRRLEQEGRTCVVILDEAQNLSAEALESVRMLSNFETTSHKLIQCVLVGQPSLATLLCQPDSEQIRQRIGIIARLEPLSAGDVSTYISHRLRVAGAERNPFSTGAMHAVAENSRGVPRMVNSICFNALTLAFATGTTSVTEREIAEVVQDLAPFPKVEARPDSTFNAKLMPAPELMLKGRRQITRAQLIAATVLLLAAGITFF